MAVKKRKRKRARSKATNPATKKRRRTKKRRAAANPAPRKRRRAKRRSASNPPKRRRASSTMAPKRRRARRANPAKKARRSKRRSRRNPDMPAWALAGLAAVAGLASYAVFGAGSFALTQRLDPTMATLDRNRYLAGGAATLLGLVVAVFASPVVGAGLAGGGLIALAGTDAYLALGKRIDKKPPAGKAIAGLFRGGNQQTVQGLYGAGDRQQLIQGLGGLYSADRMSFARAAG